MTKFTAAKVQHQGVTFAVVTVREHVLNSQTETDNTIKAMAVAMRCPLIVLIDPSFRRVRGNRQDVVDFVAKIDLRRLPWAEWTV